MISSDDLGCIAAACLILYALYIISGGRPSKAQRVLMRPGKNKIILKDGNGRYLVEAAQADDITGGPDMLLPAHIQKVHQGLYMVDFVSCNVTDVRDHVWRAAHGRIEPRTPNHVVEALFPVDYNHVRSK